MFKLALSGWAVALWYSTILEYISSWRQFPERGKNITSTSALFIQDEIISNHAYWSPGTSASVTSHHSCLQFIFLLTRANLI